MESFASPNSFLVTDGDKKILKVTHNAGLFSCSTIRLEETIKYFNIAKKLPDVLDSSLQFNIHKIGNEDITNYFYKTNDVVIDFQSEIKFTPENDDIQFTEYSKIDMDIIQPFVKKYFGLSETAQKTVEYLMDKYNLNLENLCSVFYRGLDKSFETEVASHEIFLEKCRLIKSENPDIKFLLQTDEIQFSEIFLKEFPDSIYFSELPKLSNIGKNEYYVSNQVRPQDRLSFGILFLAATYIVSQCKMVITHSGNCGIWAALFRNNFDNFYQYVSGSKFHGKNFGFWSK